MILDPKRPIAGLADSKKLSAARREKLYAQICEQALCYCVAQASVQEIDPLNILQATMLAMRRAVEGLALQPAHVQVDGNRLPQWIYSAEAIVKGDGSVAAISAASILAKVSRDADCARLDALYPAYGFSRHKGYGTAEHQRALNKFGPCAEHRSSFAPIRRALAGAL